jgi:ribA/ribD-fused uncharacterized protein
MRQMMSLQKLQDAAKLFEIDGVDGFRKAETLIGTDIALALLVAHLRQRAGSMATFAPDPSINAEVLARLKEEFGELALFFEQPHIPFYTDSHYVFDNFSAFAVQWRENLWPTVEHAYQAAKFRNVEIIAKIHRAPSAHDAKKIAHELGIVEQVREDWKEIKVPVMRELIRCKADQHPFAMKKLLSTKGYILVEDSPEDSFWGRGPDWNGENWLGKLWMEYRDEILALQAL